jgi:putative acetyltransferase
MTTIRRFHLDDAVATRQVFVDAVRIGAAGRYSAAELLDWVPDPAMPKDWGPWLDRHLTIVSDDNSLVTGFMMLEANGYLNMAFVRPELMGTGLADSLYGALLDEVHKINLTRLTTLASRWRPAPEFVGHEDLDPRQGPNDNPMNRPMALDLVAAE